MVASYDFLWYDYGCTKKNTVDVYEIRRKWMKNSVYKTDSLSP